MNGTSTSTSTLPVNAAYHAHEARLQAQRWADMDETFAAPVTQELLRLSQRHAYQVIRPPYCLIIHSESDL